MGFTFNMVPGSQIIGDLSPLTTGSVDMILVPERGYPQGEYATVSSSFQTYRTTSPFTVSTCVGVSHRTTSAKNIFGFLDPFKNDLWIATSIVTLLLGVVLLGLPVLTESGSSIRELLREQCRELGAVDDDLPHVRDHTGRRGLRVALQPREAAPPRRAPLRAGARRHVHRQPRRHPRGAQLHHLRPHVAQRARELDRV